MGRVEKSIEIKAPPEKVWEMLAFDRLPEWDEGWGDPERVEYTSEVNTPEDKYRVDATAQGIPKKPGDDYCRFEITESLEHEKIAFRAWENPKYFGILAMLQTFTLEPVGTDTDSLMNKSLIGLELIFLLGFSASSSKNCTFADGQERDWRKTLRP